MTPGRIHIKVCGMTREDNLRELLQLEPDFVGFIFYNRSARFVDVHGAKELFKAVPPHIKKVGVFVNAEVDEMLIIREKAGLDYLQLHGNESPESCSRLVSEGVNLIKMIPGGIMGNYSLLSEYEELTDYLLFDTPSALHGGSGKKFNWSDIEGENYGKPFFLSGGICSDDITDIRHFSNPAFFGVDVNSGFEISPGIKDTGRLEHFFRELRSVMDCISINSE